MYWTAISPRLSLGRSTPAMRAMWTLLSLTLLVARVAADDPHAARAAHDLAVLAPYLDRWTHFHHVLRLLEAIGDPAPGQVVGRQLDLHLVAGEDPDEVHPHLARHVGQYLVSVIQLHPEHRVGQRLHHRALHLDRVFLGHGGVS